MSSDDLAIRVVGLSKRYEIYDRPGDRLRQFVLPRLDRLAGRPVRHFHRDFLALQDVSFDVRRGEAVGIIGRNGSGKSTLLQIITGTLAPSTGEVETRGRIAALLELGSGFNPDFTGRENVYLNGALLGFDRRQIDERFDAIASFADIGGHLDQPVKTYSSGMMLRLAFAVQVQVEPDILIVDEALAVGDALFQKRCFQQIEKLTSNGTTLLFVSHDQESVRTLTHRALLLHQGATKAWGPSSEVILEYRRLLHEEETTWLGNLANEMTQRARSSVDEMETTERLSDPSIIRSRPDGGGAKTSPPSTRADRMSFGDGEVKVIAVEVLDGQSRPCAVFYPGDEINIRVKCEAQVDVGKLNVALRLRNKEGVKIYSWGTLNQDMELRTKGSVEPCFWDRVLQAGECMMVDFSFRCNLGVNLYEVQASVSYEETPDYLSQRMLHWVDEAAFFQVSMRRDEHFFGGAVDLLMRAQW